MTEWRTPSGNTLVGLQPLPGGALALVLAGQAVRLQHHEVVRLHAALGELLAQELVQGEGVAAAAARR